MPATHNPIRRLRQHADEYGGLRPAADVELIGRLYAHEDHDPADSLYGRCERCGLTWGEEARARNLLAYHSPAD